MYYGLFGRCCNMRPRTCNCFPQPQPTNQQKKPAGPCISHKVNQCVHFDKECYCENNLLIKNAAFGGFILPDRTDKRATFHVASLNLNTCQLKNFLILLDFSCNILSNASNAKLRFHLIRQEKEQCFSVPISTEILFYRDREGSEASCFTLSVCDRDAVITTFCNYSVFVKIEEFEGEGSVILANPVLIATIVNKD